MRGCSRTRSASTAEIAFPVSAPPAWTTRRTRVAALAPEVVVELDAELDEVGDPGGRLFGERSHRALAAEAAPGAERVRGMQRGRVVVGQRCGDAALRVPAVRACDRRPSRAGGRRRSSAAREGGVQAGDTAADDDQVGLRRSSQWFSPQSR